LSANWFLALFHPPQGKITLILLETTCVYLRLLATSGVKTAGCCASWRFALDRQKLPLLAALPDFGGGSAQLNIFS